MTTVTELLNLLENTACLIQKTQANVKKCSKARLTQSYVQIRIKTVEEYWETFKNAHQNLVKITPQEKRTLMSYFNNDEYDSYEEAYIYVYLLTSGTY